MAKVYVVSRVFHDLSPAERFGEIVFLSKEPISRFATSQILRTFEPVLRNSSKDDYVLVSGLTVMNILACIYLYNMHGKINILLYRQGGDEYVLRTVTIPEEVNENN